MIAEWNRRDAGKRIWEWQEVKPGDIDYPKELKMTEDEAVRIVQRHARYHKRSPPDAAYSLRWPPTNSKALFAHDTRDLVLKLLEQENDNG